MRTFASHRSLLGGFVWFSILVFSSLWTYAQAQQPTQGNPTELIDRWVVESINGVPALDLMVLELESEGTAYLETGGVREHGGTWMVIHTDGQAFLRQISDDDKSVDNTLTMIGNDRFILLSPDDDVLVFVREEPATEPPPEPIAGSNDLRFVGTWTLAGIAETPTPVDNATFDLRPDGVAIVIMPTGTQIGTWLSYSQDELDYLRLSIADIFVEAACIWVNEHRINLISATSELYVLIRQL